MTVTRRGLRVPQDEPDNHPHSPTDGSVDAESVVEFLATPDHSHQRFSFRWFTRIPRAALGCNLSLGATRALAAIAYAEVVYTDRPRTRQIPYQRDLLADCAGMQSLARFDDAVRELETCELVTTVRSDGGKRIAISVSEGEWFAAPLIRPAALPDGMKLLPVLWAVCSLNRHGGPSAAESTHTACAASLARLCGKSLRQTRRQVADAVNNGLIELSPGTGGEPNSYVVRFVPWALDADDHCDHSQVQIAKRLTAPNREALAGLCRPGRRRKASRPASTPKMSPSTYIKERESSNPPSPPAAEEKSGDTKRGDELLRAIASQPSWRQWVSVHTMTTSDRRRIGRAIAPEADIGALASQIAQVPPPTVTTHPAGLLQHRCSAEAIPPATSAGLPNRPSTSIHRSAPQPPLFVASESTDRERTIEVSHHREYTRFRKLLPIKLLVARPLIGSAQDVRLNALFNSRRITVDEALKAAESVDCSAPNRWIDELEQAAIAR